MARTERVNQRLCEVSQDQALYKLQPHQVFKADTVDFAWLVKGTTAVIRQSGLTPMGWYILQYAAWNATQNAAWNATQNAAEDAAWIAIQNAAWTDAVCSSGLSAAKDYITVADVKEYLLKLELTDPIKIVKHSYQIAECLMLRNIDKALCDKVHSIVKESGLEDTIFQLPDDLPDNPWIQQFHELY